MSREITDKTTIAEAIEILKERVDLIANSDEAKTFIKENPSWSTLFRKEI